MLPVPASTIEPKTTTHMLHSSIALATYARIRNCLGSACAIFVQFHSAYWVRFCSYIGSTVNEGSTAKSGMVSVDTVEAAAKVASSSIHTRDALQNIRCKLGLSSLATEKSKCSH